MLPFIVNGVVHYHVLLLYFHIYIYRYAKQIFLIKSNFTNYKIRVLISFGPCPFINKYKRKESYTH